MKPILEIRNLSKLYNLRSRESTYLTFRERMLNAFGGSDKKEEFWALKNVSFNVNEGQSLGIIGKNGAGKSTLLKILSRITPPTKGRVVRRGRIASLLEVGTGFHPELTGRENIFFNGSLLGMTRREILQKFEEMVDFSGVQQFLETPLKHFSSGMQLRLAFAVAAFLEPEILVIDEVLAVGDVEFQKKCMRKMEDVSRNGRTILFVSHNLNAVRSLCERSILLHKGTIEEEGPSEMVINKYLSAEEELSTEGIFDLSHHHSKKIPGQGIVSCVLLRENRPSVFFNTNDKLTAQFKFREPKPISNMMFGVVIKDSNDQPLIGINNVDLGIRLNLDSAKEGMLIFEIESLPLYGDSTYYVDLYLGDGVHNHDVILNAVKI